MKNPALFLLGLLSVLNGFSGTIPDSLRTDWSNPGMRNISYPSNTVSIMDFGGSSDSSADNTTALNAAIQSFSGGGGVVCFPSGKFLFKHGISLPANTVLHGQGSANTHIYFNLNGSGDFLTASGSVSGTSTTISSGYSKDSFTVIVANASGFAVGDFAAVKEDGNTLMDPSSSWAFPYLFQLVKISSVNGNAITFEKPLRLSFQAALNPVLIKINPIKNVGIENMSFQRLDTTAGQSSNIVFNYAANCWVKGIESYNANFGHIVLQSSMQCSISGNFIHDAFHYGGGGQGYGIVLQLACAENLVYDNIGKHLRHSYLLQAGSNGNVVAYNYSREQFWSEALLPSDAAGDIVFHGNYVFSNLIEGNICQNLVIDNSHSINGPYNTFFRNRAEYYGIVMNNGAGDRMNFVGNEITNTGFLLGNFALTGSNHFKYGNNQHGTIIPGGTTNLPENTLIGSPYGSTIGVPNTINSGKNAAYTRWFSAAPVKTVAVSYAGCGGVFATAQFTASDTTACAGGTLIFTNTSTASSGSPDSVRWSLPGASPSTSASMSTVNAVFNTAGNYTVSLIAYKGGMASAAFSITIRVKALPNVSVNSPTICNGQSATLTASGAGSYSWSTSASGASISVSPTSTTSYIVTGTQNGCTNSATATVTVNALPNVSVNSPTICNGQSATLTASGAGSYSWSTSASGASISVSPTSTTSYIVTGTQNGCTNSATATVTVNDLPNVSVNSPTICNGQSATLTASGAGSYTWSTSASGASISVSPTSTTSYIVTGTQNGCTSSATATVTVNALPNVSVNSPTICNGQSATLTASGAGSYTWSTSASGASISVSPTSTTSYIVTGTQNGCTNSATATVTVNALPNVSIHASADSVCSGDEVVLTANGADTYTWSPNGSGASVSIHPGTDVTYTVSGTSNGCSNSASQSISVHEIPSTPFITQSNDTLFSNILINGANYLWYRNDTLLSAGLNSFLVIGLEGSYTLQIEDHHCSSSISTPFTVTAIGILQKTQDIAVCVFPNPNRGAFELRVNALTLQSSQLNVYSMSGQLVLQKDVVIKPGLNTEFIDLHGSAKGTYLIRLSGKQGMFSDVVIIQ